MIIIIEPPKIIGVLWPDSRIKASAHLVDLDEKRERKQKKTIKALEEFQAAR